MIFDDFVLNKIKKLKNITIFNNFPEDTHSSIINKTLEYIKENSKKEFEVHKIFEDFDIKKLTNYINDISLFGSNLILILYKFDQNLSSLKKLKLQDDIFIFIFADEKNAISEDENISFISFPKNINVESFIHKFLSTHKLIFENKEVEDLFKSYFNNISSVLEKILEEILLYLNKIKSKTITKEIAIQFLSYSSNYSLFTIINSFFQKDKFTFFYQYMQLVESENDFNSFFQPFLKELKLLAIISSFFINKSTIQEMDKNNLINLLSKLNIQYNPYRFQYDIKKIETFGKEKIFNLLDFLLTVDLYNRYYDKFSAQKLFEIGINQFI